MDKDTKKSNSKALIIVLIIIGVLFFGLITGYNEGYEKSEHERQMAFSNGYQFGFEEGIKSLFQNLDLLENINIEMNFNETKMIDYMVEVMEEKQEFKPYLYSTNNETKVTTENYTVTID